MRKKKDNVRNCFCLMFMIEIIFIDQTAFYYYQSAAPTDLSLLPVSLPLNQSTSPIQYLASVFSSCLLQNKNRCAAAGCRPCFARQCLSGIADHASTYKSDVWMGSLLCRSAILYYPPSARSLLHASRQKYRHSNRVWISFRCWKHIHRL